MSGKQGYVIPSPLSHISAHWIAKLYPELIIMYIMAWEQNSLNIYEWMKTEAASWKVNAK